MTTEPRTVTTRDVFVTGGTGYIGRPVVAALVERGHRLRALVRPASQLRLPHGCTSIVGDALDASTFSMHVAGCDTLLQLVGTPHRSPSKAAEFERVDLVSARESCRAANAGEHRSLHLSRPAVGERIIAVPDIRRTEESSRRSAQDDNVS
jgi:uncharacterized protein YbjT (DUF2867 family)